MAYKHIECIAVIRNKMKALLIIFSILLLSSCSDGSKKSSNIEQDTVTKHESDSATQKIDYHGHDTIFYNDRFLVFGSKKMKLDYISSQDKNPKICSVGDTLFHDSYATILGDEKFTTMVYVKYYSKYKFSQFLVDSIYEGKLMLPDLSSISDQLCQYLSVDQWKEFVNSECIKQGVNFAGHYTIVEWGCGCQCQNMAIIDRINGKIIFPDKTEDYIYEYYGAQYRKESRMIITNSAVLEDYEGYYWKYFDCYPKIYEWRDTISKRLE